MAAATRRARGVAGAPRSSGRRDLDSSTGRPRRSTRSHPGRCRRVAIRDRSAARDLGGTGRVREGGADAVCWLDVHERKLTVGDVKSYLDEGVPLMLIHQDLAGGKAVVDAGEAKGLERDDPLGWRDFSGTARSRSSISTRMGEGTTISFGRSAGRPSAGWARHRSIDKARRLVEHGAAKVCRDTGLPGGGVDQEFLSELAGPSDGRGSSSPGQRPGEDRRRRLEAGLGLGVPPSSKRRRPSPRSSCSPGWNGKA